MDRLRSSAEVRLRRLGSPSEESDLRPIPRMHCTNGHFRNLNANKRVDHLLDIKRGVKLRTASRDRAMPPGANLPNSGKVVSTKVGCGRNGQLFERSSLRHLLVLDTRRSTMSFARRSHSPRPVPQMGRASASLPTPRPGAVRPDGPAADDGLGLYPFIVVRLMSTVYQAEKVDVRVGCTSAEVSFERSFLQHPSRSNLMVR